MPRVLGTAGSCLVVLMVAAGFLAAGGGQKDQPIAYNHARHVGELGMECTDCHLRAETAARAGIPNIEICSDCHADPDTENEEERKLVNFVLEEQRVSWVQVHRVPDYAYFSHRRHVALGEINCTVCHGDVATMEKPFTEPFQEIKMSWCMDCHERRSVTNECTACHR